MMDIRLVKRRSCGHTTATSNPTCVHCIQRDKKLYMERRYDYNRASGLYVMLPDYAKRVVLDFMKERNIKPKYIKEYV
jgi:hypothetical protein